MLFFAEGFTFRNFGRRLSGEAKQAAIEAISRFPLSPHLRLSRVSASSQ
jgi:hypothetical protein